MSTNAVSKKLFLHLLKENCSVVVAQLEADVFIGQKGDGIVISNDSDLLVYEKTTHLIRPMQGQLFLINKQKFIETLEVDLEGFIWLCSLCGNDYAKIVPNKGFASVLKTVKQRKGLIYKEVTGGLM
ncbi:hypothetical protein HDU92_002935 [Lobulomyces angularis]|nr:hypothetical protein HDU92_002935 [Lobulomyces angularis]